MRSALLRPVRVKHVVHMCVCALLLLRAHVAQGENLIKTRPRAHITEGTPLRVYTLRV